MDASTTLLDRLIADGLLIPSGVDGIYARSIRFERIVDALDALVGRVGAPDGPEVLRFPPAMPRSSLVRSGYLKSFPQLLGTIHCFCGNEADHRALLHCVDANEDWTSQQRVTDLLLTPASCYPLYPIIATRGRLPREGGIYDMHAWCFRHEPSLDPARMQTFRVREFVRMGVDDQVLAFRQLWLERAQDFISDLVLPYAIDVANDPFFGRVGQVMAVSQRQQALKFELLIPYYPGASPTACMSFNYHREHFGHVWGIHDEKGDEAHTSCVAFGIDRLAVALFANHGVDFKKWPASARQALAL